MNTLKKSDQETLDFLIDAIKKNSVSIDISQNEPIKQYIIYLPDERILSFTVSIVLEKTSKRPYFEYSINIDGNELTTIYLTPGAAMLTPGEKMIVDLFKMCSQKLIMQEVQSMIGGVLSANNNQKIN